ncbi:O-antigen ligase family protein [Chitinophaga sp. SYP-B3965]|uniref:O-antigen ligase family protein n=1 Tax=Chitinophaga sp. SYP-B3965 TaxID=2663120 RepID=UPI0015650D9D|nr:O-antigen ligase family protein [Chitinophaga sp. SYP-B3965]
MKNVFSLMRTENRSGGNMIVIVLITGCLLYAIFTMNRAFTIGYAFALLIVLYPMLRKWRYIIAGLLALLPFVLAISMKTGSSKGRMLIYKISASIFRDHYAQGIGWGKFQTVYNNYQAAYFSKGNYTTAEFLSADNTYFAFNDYFQWMIEGGWIAIIGIPLLIVMIIWLMLKTRRSPLLIIAVAQLAAIMIAACFTHVFEKPLFQCLAVMAIVIIAGIRWFYAAIPAILLLLFHYGHYLWYYKDYQQIKEAKTLSSTGNRAAALQIYEILHPRFRQYPEFFMDYGTLLLEMQEAPEAKKILLQACTMRPNNNWLMKLGEAYEETGDLKQAEAVMLKAVYMVPNRFGSKMELFSFYQRYKRFNQAEKWGKIILEQPVKIPSDQVERIKKYISEQTLLFSTP